jgi:hypothetical protein
MTLTKIIYGYFVVLLFGMEGVSANYTDGFGNVRKDTTI